MTPRESLEAAGWRADRETGLWWPPSKPWHWYSEQQAIAQLARDKAKETSDGERESGIASARSVVGNDAGAIGAGDCAAPAPVATSVSAPDRARAEQWMRENKNSLPGPLTDSDWDQIRNLLAEYASSSSAALRKMIEIQGLESDHDLQQIGELANKWSAAEAKCARETERADYNAEAAAKNLTLVQALRDSRDRLQEALMAAANHLHYVGQEQAAGQARKALSDPVPDTE